MDLSAEEEQLAVAVVPAVIGTEHFVVLPHVRSKAKIGGGKVAPVFQAGCFHKGGVQVHVHLVVEHKEAGLGVVRAVLALNYLAVLVTHGRSALEYGHGVLGVVIKVSRAEGVFVGVFQLDKVSAEAGHVVVHHILQRGAGKLCPVLDNTDMPYGVDYVGVDVPKGGVTEEICVVVEKLGRAYNLSETLAILFYKLCALRADKADLVCLLGHCLAGQKQEQG